MIPSFDCQSSIHAVRIAATLSQKVPRRVQIQVLHRLLADRARSAESPAASVRGPRLPDLFHVEAAMLGRSACPRPPERPEGATSASVRWAPSRVVVGARFRRHGLRHPIPHDRRRLGRGAGCASRRPETRPRPPGRRQRVSRASANRRPATRSDPDFHVSLRGNTGTR